MANRKESVRDAIPNESSANRVQLSHRKLSKGASIDFLKQSLLAKRGLGSVEKSHSRKGSIATSNMFLKLARVNSRGPAVPSSPHTKIF